MISLIIINLKAQEKESCITLMWMCMSMQM